MQNKNPYRSQSIKRRLELLKRHYDYDEETKTFDIVLHYPTADELFDAEFDLTKLPVINDEVIDTVSDMLGYIPRGYKAEFSLVIDDYGEHDPNSVLFSFNEALRIRYDLYQDESKRHGAKIGALMLFGLFFIVVTIVGEVDGWWLQTDVSLRLINYFLDTLGCVLIWEGIYAALLEPSELISFGDKLTHRMGGLGVYGPNSDNPLCSETDGAISSLLRNDFRKRFGSICLLISAFGFFLSGVTDVIVAIGPLVAAIEAGENLALYVASPLVNLLISVALGLLTFRLFYEDYRWYALNIIASVLFVFAIGTEIYWLCTGKVSGGEIVSDVLMLLVLVLYTIGFGVISFLRFKEKREGRA